MRKQNLDVSWLNDRGNVLLTLNTVDQGILELAGTELTEKSGVRIDPYGTTRISPAHARILADSLDSASAGASTIAEFQSLLHDAVQTDRWLVLEGD